VHKIAASDVDWETIRNDFPVLNQSVHGHPLIYFDNAASSQKPRAVLDAVRHYYEHDNANVHRGLHALSSRATEAYETSRLVVAEYIGAASEDEIVFTRGTTESINLVAQAWGGRFLRPNDVILLTEMEHHSNLVPWQLLSERTGARLRFVPVRDDGTLDLDQLWSLLTPEVKLFAFTHVSNSLGTINPVAELCAKAHAVGALTLVDAAQSASNCWKKMTPYAPRSNAGHHTTRAAATTATDVACCVRSALAPGSSGPLAGPLSSTAPM